MKRNIVIIIHLLAVLLFAAGLGALHEYSTEEYGVTWIRNADFESSAQFSELVGTDIHNIKRLAVLKAAFEEDGEVSNDNTVAYAATRNGSMSYSLGDIITMAGRFGYTMDAETHAISAARGQEDANNYEVRVTFKAYDPYYFDNIEPGPSQGVMPVRDLCLEVMRALGEYYSLHAVYGTEMSNFLYDMSFVDFDDEELTVQNTSRPPDSIRALEKYIRVDADYHIDTNIEPQPEGILSTANSFPFAESETDVMTIGIDTEYLFNDRYKQAADRFAGSIHTVLHWLMVLAVSGLTAVISLVPVVRGTGAGRDRRREYALDRLPYEAMVLLFAGVSVAVYYLFKLSVYNVVEIAAAREDWVFWRRLARAVIIWLTSVVLLASTYRRAVNGGIFRSSLLHGAITALTEERSESAAWNALKGFAAVVLLNLAGAFGILWFYMHRLEQTNYLIAFWILSMILAALDILIYVILYRQTRQRAEIKDAVKRISDGETGYVIPEEGFTGDELGMVRSLNSISGGLTRAINEQVKAERLKADLITNVSHDIRTPLTSIINYVDLIKREDSDNPRINEYIEVLDKKSARLKNLTEDLLEASKASSGNVRLEMGRLDMVELGSQAGGEFEDKFAARHLELILTTPDEHAYVLADGRHLWRVFENLYNNAAKYALEGTRVYADVLKKDGKCIFTIKNVSQDKLNISPDELTERFVRGDVSRTTEGSGLGLSIAKSLTRLMGGELVIEIDGDLYKASVVLPEHAAPAETTTTEGTLEIE